MTGTVGLDDEMTSIGTLESDNDDVVAIRTAGFDVALTIGTEGSDDAVGCIGAIRAFSADSEDDVPAVGSELSELDCIGKLEIDAVIDDASEPEI